jgi:hypothetical protein
MGNRALPLSGLTRRESKASRVGLWRVRLEWALPPIPMNGLAAKSATLSRPVLFIAVPVRAGRSAAPWPGRSQVMRILGPGTAR